MSCRCRSTIRSLLAAACIFFLGCAPTLLRVRQSIQAHPDQGYFIEGVPFYPQTDLACGPSAVASVLNYFGIRISQEEIARQVVSPRLGGTLNLDLYLYVKDKGMRAEICEGGFEVIKKEIRERHPVIAFVNLGFLLYPIGHYLVIVGYDDTNQVLIVHWGDEENRIITYRKFLNAWKKTGEWALLVLPK